MKPVDLDLDVQYAAADLTRLPGEMQINRWIERTLTGRRGLATMTLRIVDEAEMTELNGRYRGKDYPTNVLSFPFDGPPGVAIDFLGDVVVCAPVVEREAAEQGKSIDAHWAHLVVHGCLHLLGYDHEEEGEATRMETLETEILAGLGYGNPYADE